MRKGSRKSLRNRILLSVMFGVLLPIMIGMVVWWSKTIKIREEDQIALHEENTTYFTRLCENIFDEKENKALLLYMDQKCMDILEQKNVTVNEQKILSSKISAIFYSDSDAESVTLYLENSQWIISKKRNESSRMFKVESEEQLEKYFITSYPENETKTTIKAVEKESAGERQIVFGQRIKANGLQPVARFEVVYNRRIFEPIFYGMNQVDESTCYVLDEDGVLFYEETGDSFSETFKGQFESLEDGITTHDEYLFIKNKMNSYPCYVLRVISKKVLLEDMVPLKNSMLLLFALIFIVVVLIAFVMARLVRKPIRIFTDSIVQFRNSGENVNIDIKPGIEEMNDLSVQFSSMMNEINQLIDEKSMEQYRTQKAHFRMLMVQINPHFLYNALQTLQFMALKRDAFEINSMLESLGKILRYSLNWEQESVTLEEEVANTIEYLNIQKFRYVDELLMQIDIPDKLPECQVPKMILQPLVENCFVHGFRTDSIDYRVRLEIICEQDDIIIKISDNGKGMEEEQIELFNQRLTNLEGYTMTEHTGLESVIFRIRQMYEGASMHIYSDEWFFVEIRITAKEKRTGNGLRVR